MCYITHFGHKRKIQERLIYVNMRITKVINIEDDAIKHVAIGRAIKSNDVVGCIFYNESKNLKRDIKEMLEKIK